MLAVQGIYEDGKIHFSEKISMNKAKVIVIFTEEDIAAQKRFSQEESLKFLDEFAGTLTDITDTRKELLEALDEKYASVD